MRKADGELQDISYAVYNIIKKSDVKNQASLLQFFIERSEDIESNEEMHIEKIYSEEEKYQYRIEYGKMIDGTLESLIQKGYSCEKFYSDLWKFIENSPVLSDDKARAFAVYYIWIDVRVPYFELDDGIKMSNEDYSTISDKLSNKIKKARFILTAPANQRTERASRLLDILEGLNDNKEKTVFLSQIISLCEHSNDILKQLLAEGRISLKDR